jgi:uncharacterized membrane protein
MKKEWVKKILLNIGFGIMWGCTWFVLIWIIADMTQNQMMLSILQKQFTKQALGGMIVGIGFTLPSIVYSLERLAFLYKVSIHLGVGAFVFFPTAFTLGWMPVPSFGVFIGYLLLFMTLFFVIWFGFYLYYRKEIKEINKRLKQTKQGQ